MSTIKRYEQDVNLRELDTTVISLERYLDRPALVLAETLFFPQGGGQPWDLGTIGGVALAGVVEADGIVYHLLDSDPPAGLFAPGLPVHCILDWERRFDHMQRHCGEHILSGIFFQEYGGVNRGFHMGDEYMTIDIRLEQTETESQRALETITWDMALHAETLANQAIWQNLPVTVRRFGSAEEAAGLPLRKALAVDEDITIVCVGSEANPSDCVACCGTHPTTSGQVGLIKLYKVENYKGMFRIYFEAGQRALAAFQKSHDTLTTLCTKYSAGQDDLLEKIDAREKKNTEVRNGFYLLRKSVIQSRIAEILAAASKASDLAAASLKANGQAAASPKVPMMVRTYDDLPQEDLLTMGRGVVETYKGLLILHFPKEHTLFLFSQGKPDCGKLVRDHLDIYNGKGGGNATSSRIIFSKPEYPDLFVDLLEKHLR